MLCGEGNEKKTNQNLKPLSVSNFGLLRSAKAKEAQSRSEGLPAGHPIHARVPGIPTAGSSGEVWRRVKGAKTCNRLSSDRAANCAGVLVQSPHQVCLERESSGMLALLFIQQLTGLSEKLLDKAASILPL